MMAPVMVPTIVTSENSVSAAAADASSYIYTKGSSFQNKEDGEAKISPAEVEELFRSQYPDPFQNDVVENHVTNLQTTPLPTSKPLAEKTTISKTDKPAHNNDLPNVQETSKLVEQQAPIDPIVKQAKVKKNFAYKTFSNLSDESDEDVRNDGGRDFSDRYYASEDEEDEEVPDEVKKVRETKKPLELSVSSRARVDVVGGQEPFPIISPPKKKDSGARKLVRREERIVATKSVGAVNPDDDPFANAPGFGQRTTAVRAQALASLDGNVPSCSRQSFSGVSNASVFAAATRKSSDASARAAYNPFVCSNNSSNSSLDQIKPGSSSASTPTNLNEAVRPSTDAFGAAPFNPQPGAKALVKKRAASLACASSSSSQQSHTHHPAAVQCSTKETRSATKDTTIIRQIAQHHHSQAHPMVHQRTKLPQALRSKHAQIDSKLPTKGISNISFDDS